jgi:hypothetical protein
MGIRDDLAERFGEDLLFADSFDDAIIGVAVGFDSQRVIYDVQKMIEAGVKNGMDYDESQEWLEYNTFGAYVGENTPIYMEGYVDDN